MGKKRILIIDDSPIVHRVLGAKLKAAGFEVLHAPEGVAGINTCRGELPDLVLLDINMPVVSGYQVCHLLKDNPITKTIPMIVMTDPQAPQMATDPKTWSSYMGADSFIDKVKATQGNALAETVKHHLSKIAANPFRERLGPLTQTQILAILSQLLDQHFYSDITHLINLNERKTHFVANVSHEFKSPLMLIKGNLENIQEGYCGATSEPQQKAIDSALRAVRRLSRLVIDLLDLARIETGKMTLKNETLCLESLLDAVIETYREVIRQKELKIQKEIASALPSIVGDPDRLAQVLTNLFTNSLKYTPPKGQIYLRLSRENAHVRLEIEDSGPGIAKENLEKVFDKFERIMGNKEEGTGLGLPIAHEIAALHGGKLWAESEPGQGAKFILTLPLLRERERERERGRWAVQLNNLGMRRWA